MKKSSPSDIAKMDSLKIPKGGSSKPPSGSVPITVRFNAGEESLDDIFQSFHNSASGGGGGGGGDSLSSSPQQQNPDEVNARNNFLQGNFFNRKRAGSIEGPSPTSSTVAPISALSTSESNSVGTWKLIKGKVSQAMEDIKSSKTTNPSAVKGDDPDSDQENATINSSISDDFSLEQEFKTALKCDSDSDIEPDILLEGDVERSRIRRSFAHLKSKVKARSQGSGIPITKASLTVNATASASGNSGGSGKKEQSPSRGATPTTSNTGLRNAFLRKRKKPVVEGTEAALAATATSTPPAAKEKKGIIAGKKEIEIESGVEMLEDMVPAVPEVSAASKPSTEVDSESTNAKRSMDLPIDSIAKPGEGKISATSTLAGSAESQHLEGYMSGFGPPKAEPVNPIYVVVKSIPFVSLIFLLMVLCIPSIPDFVRGVFSCLLLMLIFSSAWHYVQQAIVARITANGPEKFKFKIPDFKHMPICEIPAVEEHKTVKTYTGWMNEIHSYDPGNFHVTMTKSVYVKLDGSMLRVSNTTARVPKRQMWNEPVIDRKTITFTRHRTFNLLGCRIEMLPRGLARKRYFSRKYPMQLIIKNTDGQNTEEAFTFVTAKEEKSSLKRPSSSKSLDEKLLEGKSNKASEMKENTLAPGGILHQNSSESMDDRSERSILLESENDLDFAATVLNADLKGLQENIPDLDLTEVTVPCGDETRILLFARGDREKEDWYRRFVAASTGDINDQDLHLPNVVMVSEAEIKAAAKAASLLPESTKNKEVTTPSKSMTTSLVEDSKANDNSTVSEKSDKVEKITKKRNSANSQDGKESTPDAESTEGEKIGDGSPSDETYEGLLISTCAARNPLEYIRFMSRYQSACNQTRIPVFKARTPTTARMSTRTRRGKRQEDELWKGIDQSLFLGPSGSVVWANVFIGRVLFSCLNDSLLLGKIQDFLQKKLSSIKLPSFMEDVSITQIFLGDTPPLIHRVSQPVLDERGTWIDADLTYEGLMHMTITTKLNLLRLKRQHTAKVSETTGASTAGGTPPLGSSPPTANTENEIPTADQLIDEVLTNCAIYDSDAESSGASSSETGSPTAGSLETNTADTQFFNSSPGNARRLFKIVDRIAASNLFQYATELSYVQKAMENMSTNITLRVDLKGLVSRVTINIPPPPSDRIWLAFRGPPRLWISATPTVGDHTFDWSIVTNVIESKLCEEAYKYLVYPNMIDVIVPFLGQSTYKE